MVQHHVGAFNGLYDLANGPCGKELATKRPTWRFKRLDDYCNAVRWRRSLCDFSDNAAANVENNCTCQLLSQLLLVTATCLFIVYPTPAEIS